MNQIQKYRKLAGIKQRDLAELAGVSASAISHYETGIRTPDIKTSKRLVSELSKLGISCSLDQLFGETDESEPKHTDA
ncbi:helix-turn-helix domain-containing protein [Morganella morganii]|uniref:helix-turn-helix domain-containing protein n=1 Tax=Morganella morganii TaxID=582 RepID=UPI0034E5A108